MSEQRHILLSSKRSFLMMYVALIACVLFIPVMFLAAAESGGIHIGTIIGFIIYLFAILILYIFFSSVCEARVIGNTLELRRFNKKAKTFTFDKISALSSMTLSRSRYTNLEMTLEDGTTDFYIIANNASLPYDEPERILRELNPNAANITDNEPSL